MRSWLIAAGVLVVAVVFGVLARQTPLLRGWGQPVVSVLLMLFLYWEGWKQGLGDDGGEPDAQVRDLQMENKRLKELVADLSIENHLLKKSE